MRQGGCSGRELLRPAPAESRYACAGILVLASHAALLGRTLWLQRRDDEALAFTQIGLAAAAPDDLVAQILCRAVRAQVLTRRGELDGAHRLSAQAVALANRTDWLTDRADALVVRAEVHRAAGDPDAAAATLEDALALYARKGHAIGARRARDAVADLVAA